jgi:hypothetical protein
MALAGPVVSARDRKEFTGMVLEKQAALAKAWFGILTESARLQQQMLLGCFTGRAPSLEKASNALAAKAVSPFHSKAVSNAKRLARTRLR